MSALQRTSIPKIGNIYSQKRNCAASVPISNFHINVSSSDLVIPTIDLPILVQEMCGPILGIYKSLTDTWDMNVEIGTEAVQFPEKAYINGIFVAVCDISLTLFYTRDLGIVVLHVMVSEPYRFPLCFLK